MNKASKKENALVVERLKRAHTKIRHKNWRQSRLRCSQSTPKQTNSINNQYSLGVLKLHLLAKRNPMVAPIFISGILTAEQIHLHQCFVSACPLTSVLIVILQYINDPNH